jgi:hypothetical protein
LDIIRIFERGELDEKIFKEGEVLTPQRMKLDLGTFIHATALYQNPELRLQTGVADIPKPIEEEDSVDKNDDLLTQLGNDPDTKGLARLTRRVMASVHLPMHSLGSSDQRFGGVSDISNRGDFDKLLLSELAHDDDSLVARLVNNEALYLKHEEPPVPLDRKRIVLVDSTIKMWGVPRVFAVAAALSCTVNNKKGITIEAYSLSGNDCLPIALDTKEGVITALGRLSHHLDCVSALSDFLKTINEATDCEVILVTGKGFLKNELFVKKQQEIQSKLGYLITVSRQGELEFHQMGLGRKRMLNRSEYDLEEILFAPDKDKRRPDGELPAFIKLVKNLRPLVAPAVGIRYLPERFFETRDGHLLVITEDNQVLLWKGRGKGATEILPFIEEGNYAFLENDDFSGYLLVVYNTRLFKLYEINEGEVDFMDFSNFTLPDLVLADEYEDDDLGRFPYFLVKTGNKTGAIYKDDSEFNFKFEWDSKPNKSLSDAIMPVPPPITKAMRRTVNNGYSVLRRVYRVSINAAGELMLDNQGLQQENNHLKFRIAHTTQTERAITITQAIDPEKSRLPESAYIELHTFEFEDGSQVVVDYRGYLHLRSSNPRIPEVTLVLALEKPIAAWSSDGRVTGSDYFIQDKGNYLLPVLTFYNKYINPFTEHIIKSSPRT